MAYTQNRYNKKEMVKIMTIKMYINFESHFKRL